MGKMNTVKSFDRNYSLGTKLFLFKKNNKRAVTFPVLPAPMMVVISADRRADHDWLMEVQR